MSRDKKGSKQISQSCGRAGRGSIDLFTGDLTFYHEDVNLNGLHLPLNICHVYNSSDYNENFNTSYKCGLGWKLNFMQKLVLLPSDPNKPNMVEYSYINADGISNKITKRYYKNATTTSGGKTITYKRYGYSYDTADVLSEVSNSQYVLTEGSTERYLTDAAGNKLCFEKGGQGRLIRLEKKEANWDGRLKMHINYASLNNIIITDGTGRTASLNFVNGFLKTIVYSNDTITYDYTGDLLKKITYGTMGSLNFSQFDYENSRLKNVKDISGLTLEYNYNGTQKEVIGYSVFSEVDSISYNENSNLGASQGQEKVLESISILYDRKNSDTFKNLRVLTDNFGVQNSYYFREDGSLYMEYDDRNNMHVNFSKVISLVEEGGIENEITMFSGDILQSSPNLLPANALAGTLNGNQNGEEKFTHTLFSQSTYHGLGSGWYVFTAAIKGNINPCPLVDDAFGRSDMSYAALSWTAGTGCSASGPEFVFCNPEISDWQYVALPFYIHNPNNTYYSIQLSIILNRNPNSIQIKDCSFRKTTIDYPNAETTIYGNQEIRYNANNILKVQTLAKDKYRNKYATYLTAQDGVVTESTRYSEEYPGRVTSHTSIRNVTTSYGYDTAGNVISQTIEDGDTFEEMQVSRYYGYLDNYLNQNVLSWDTDEMSNTTKADYYSPSANLKSITEAGTNQKTQYSYSGFSDSLLSEVKALENLSKNVSETANTLKYNLGLLTKLTHNGFGYDFVYDGFGRVKAVYVGGSHMLSTTYTDSGSNIDGVIGAVKKVVSYYNKKANDLFEYAGGGLFAGSGMYTAKKADNTVLDNEAYASYYDKYGMLIRVRYKINWDGDNAFASADDYITITETFTHGVRRIIVLESGINHIYSYDVFTGDMVLYSEEVADYTTDPILQIAPTKDNYGRLGKVNYTVSGMGTKQYEYTYRSAFENEVKDVKLPNNIVNSIDSDNFGRLKSYSTTGAGTLKSEYAYKTNGNYTTPLVSSLTYKKGTQTVETDLFDYDTNNNITKITDSAGVNLSEYEYDGLGRLVKEWNSYSNITKAYGYDAGGNLSKKNTLTGYYMYPGASNLLSNSNGRRTNYTYYTKGNQDRLKTYNGSGDINYDNLGNPKEWFIHGTNNSVLSYSLYWNQGKNLARMMRKTGITAGYSGVYYGYNSDGIRIRKGVHTSQGMVEHSYVVNGSTIIVEKITQGNSTKNLFYYYDQTGICGFNYNGSDYYFAKSLQGDVVRVYNSSGTVVGSYSYDAWGVCTIGTDINGIATLNPWRYRGYYYDQETGLYYLNTRYYDPVVGRFINADDIDYLDPESINGLNLYAYCYNNPVNKIDPNGNSSIEWIEKHMPWLIRLINFSLTQGEKLLNNYKSKGYFMGYDLGNYAEVRGNNATEQIWNQFLDRTYMHFFKIETVGDFLNEGLLGVGQKFTVFETGFQSRNALTTLEIISAYANFDLMSKDNLFAAQAGIDLIKVTQKIGDVEVAASIGPAIGFSLYLGNRHVEASITVFFFLTLSVSFRW